MTERGDGSTVHRRRRRAVRLAAVVVSCAVVATGAAVVNLVAPPASAGTLAADDWAELQSILSGLRGTASAPIKNVVTKKYTAGMLLGNGDIGVVAGGDSPGNQRFYFGKGDFYGSAYSSGHHRLDPAILSLGNLTISSPVPSTARTYQMTQDIQNAEVDSTLNLGGATVSMRSYTADSDNVFVTELSSPAGAPPVPLKIDLTLPPAQVSNPDVQTTYPTTVGAAAGTIWATRHNNLTGAGDFQAEDGIAVRPVGVGFDSTTVGDTTASGTFTLQPGQTVDLATVFRGDARAGSGGPDATSLATAATAAVTGLTSDAVSALRDAHRAWWKDYWLKSLVQLNDPTMMAYWYGSLYVMGSASRPGKVAPGMNGPWVIDDYTQFPRYWMNYNFEAPFYGLASANHPDLIEPYNHQEWAELPWQVNYTAGGGYAGEMFTRSLAPFHQFMPAPAAAPVAPVRNELWTDQKSNGGFAVMPSIFYYEYTHDQAYLTGQLYPTLLAVDAFFRDYMTWDGTRYVMKNSSAHEASVDLNPNLDLGFIRRVATLLITYSQQLHRNLGLIPVWRNVLAHLSAYPTATVNGQTVFTMAENINGSTDPKVTFSPGDQPINMEGTVFPGENLAVGGDPTQLQIARNTLQQMNSWGVTTGENKNNGFPKEFPVAARVGWPAADLMTKFDAAIRAQWRASNLTVAQSGGGIETSGSVEAVDSMLMQSVTGTIRLFADADWPAGVDAHFKRLRAVGGFEVSAALSGGAVGPVTIASDAGQPVVLQDPWPTARGVMVWQVNAAGQRTLPVPASVAGGVIRFATVAGRAYEVSPIS